MLLLLMPAAFEGWCQMEYQSSAKFEYKTLYRPASRYLSVSLTTTTEKNVIKVEKVKIGD